MLVHAVLSTALFSQVVLSLTPLSLCLSLSLSKRTSSSWIERRGFLVRTGSCSHSNAGGLLDRKHSLRCLFRRGTPPVRSSFRLSVEEGLVRSITVDAVGYGRNALYDQMLPRNAGIGRPYLSKK